MFISERTIRMYLRITRFLRSTYGELQSCFIDGGGAAHFFVSVHLTNYVNGLSQKCFEAFYFECSEVLVVIKNNFKG